MYQRCGTNSDTVVVPVHVWGEVRRLAVDRVKRLKKLLKELSELDNLWAQGHRADAFKDYREFLLREISKLKEEGEVTENKIIILSEEEQNPFANERFSRNGGGYLQPHYRFEYKGIVGDVYDNNCGEYGEEYHVYYNGQQAGFSNKDGWEDAYTTFTDGEFVEAFNEEFPCYWIGLAD